MRLSDRDLHFGHHLPAAVGDHVREALDHLTELAELSRSSVAGHPKAFHEDVAVGLLDDAITRLYEARSYVAPSD